MGFTVDATALPDSAGWVLEVSVRVPPATIRQLWRDPDGMATLRATARVKVKGRAPLESTREFRVAVADSAVGQGRVVLMTFPGTPGDCDVDVKLVDLLSRKRGVMHASGDDHESMEIAGGTEVPSAQAGRDLSDLEFLWPEAGADAGLAFVRNGRVLVPNPDRLYGLMAGEMRARFVARGRRGAPPRPWHWVARVFDAAGNGVAQRESTAAAAPLLDTDVAFDVAHEPAGAYTLEIKAWQQDDPGAVQRRSRFSIGWKADTWLRSAADVADEVHFLLPAEDEEAFATTPPGEQERLLEEFWARRDPTPETAENEALDTFRERVAHANAIFGSFGGREKGMFSDMGRVYIRYGEPSEVLKQVMPAGNETLTEQLQEILDTEQRSPEDVVQRGPGGDQRPYEVWIYEGGQVPMPLDVEPNEAGRGRGPRRLLFLFVDDHGTGTYRLRYSTE